MATTTNFGWTTPDDTDLVKDGAAAIRTLGSAIDTSLVDLKGGTTGQVLSKASNTDMDFSWIASGGGKVLQVVTSNYSTQVNITSSTYTDTGLSVSITPSAASSKVLILVSQPLYVDQAANQANGYSQLLRGSTQLVWEQVNGIYAGGASATSLHSMVVFTYLDSPSTTSATTYKTQGKKDGNTILRYQITPQTSTITAIEIGA